MGVSPPSFQFISRLARVKGASRARGGGPGRQVNVWAKLYTVVRDAVGVVALVAVMLGIAGGVAVAILVVGRLIF